MSQIVMVGYADEESGDRILDLLEDLTGVEFKVLGELALCEEGPYALMISVPDARVEDQIEMYLNGAARCEQNS